MIIVLVIIGYIVIAALSLVAFAKMGAYTKYGHGSSPDARAADIFMRALFWPVGWPLLILDRALGLCLEAADTLINRYKK